MALTGFGDLGMWTLELPEQRGGAAVAARLHPIGTFHSERPCASTVTGSLQRCTGNTSLAA